MHRGWGECVPYARYGETMETVAAQVKSLPRLFDRDDLLALLPAGAARNAVDCALWDLEAKEASRPVWDSAGLSAPKPEITAYTLSLDTPEAMNAQAAKHAFRPLLKTKLGGGEEDVDRIRAVRAGALDARIIVPAGQDEALLGLDRVLPVCADESCHDRSSLDGLLGKYDMVNIKLDKTGGLTEALELRRAAIAMGFDVMVGCMIGSSLAMAPAILVAQGAAVVDLDGPLLLGEDRANKLFYDAAGVHPAAPELWG